MRVDLDALERRFRAFWNREGPAGPGENQYYARQELILELLNRGGLSALIAEHRAALMVVEAAELLEGTGPRPCLLAALEVWERTQ